MRKKISRDDLLESKPVLNPDTHVEELDSGGVVISYRERRSLWGRLLAFIVPKPTIRQVVLDNTGGFVVRAIRKNVTIREILSLLANERNIEAKDAEIALLRFLSMLGQRGIIVLQSPKPHRD